MKSLFLGWSPQKSKIIGFQRNYTAKVSSFSKVRVALCFIRCLRGWCGITLYTICVIQKALKYKLGMSKVEYVGNIISKDGLRMPDKLIRGVNDFHKSEYKTRLRLFLGFIYHLRDHVPNHSNVVSFLSKMI